MANATGTLTVAAIKSATAGKWFDGGGLFLDVRPNGARYWRLKYRHAGRERLLAFGVYPEVSLAEARARRDSARATMREGRDPSAERKADKVRAVLSSANTFEAVAREWVDKQRASLAAITLTKAEWQLGFAFPHIGQLPIAEVTAPAILALLKPLEKRGTHETAARVKQRISQVMRFAVATGRATGDPTRDLRGALSPFNAKPRAALTRPDDVATLLRAIDGYTGQPVTLAALQLAPLLFVRPGNLRAMEWAELDLKSGEWRIPAGKMKMRDEHTVPLAPQAVAILTALRALTGKGRYCFPSLRTSDRPMSENTVNAGLRRLGFDKDTMTGHGFRAMASTRLNEMGWAPDVIERQLAHAQRNKVRAAYNRAQYMAERRKMMTSWADYLDQLKDGNRKVVPIKRKA